MMKSANQANNKPLYNLLKMSVIKSLDIFAFKPNKRAEAVQQNTIEIERTVDY